MLPLRPTKNVSRAEAPDGKEMLGGIGLHARPGLPVVDDSLQVGTGRRLHAVREVARRALAFLAADIAAHAQTAVEHETRVLAMEARAEASNRNRYGAAAPVLDRRVASTAIGIESHLESQERVYGASRQRGIDAAFLRRKLFPQGAGAIVQLPYVPEYERINALLERAREPEIAAVVARLPELSDMLAELETANREYGDALGACDRDRPASEELLAAQTRGQELARDPTLISAVLRAFCGFSLRGSGGAPASVVFAMDSAAPSPSFSGLADSSI